MVRSLILAVLLLAFPSPELSSEEQSPVQLLFEGYYKITIDGSHSGYVIQRYRLDRNKKEFESTYFIRTSEAAGNTAESLKATANQRFEPLAYEYTWASGPENSRQIDARFVGQTMMARTGEESIRLELPEGTFLSSFLSYLMLQSGLKKGLRLSYQTVLEESGSLAQGVARITGETELFGLKAFKVENRLIEEGKGESRFVSHITPEGVVLKNSSPERKIEFTLVAQAEEATRGFQLPTSTIETLFGSVPAGRTHPLASPIDQNLPEENPES